MLHRQKGQFQPYHAPDLARPKAARINDVFTPDRALFGDDVPRTIRILRDLFNLVSKLDRSAQSLRRFGISVRCSRRIEVPFDRIP